MPETATPQASRTSRTSINSPSTPSGSCPWTWSRRPSPAIPALPWGRRPWRISSGRASCATTRPTRTGPTATASSSPAATPRRSSTPSSTWAATTCPWKSIQHFRQFGSLTPGHPEHELTTGVETTTGPLGQGIGNAVGMAIAQCLSAQRFNREGFSLFDYRIWAFVSDGDMMEGISHEACSPRRPPQAQLPQGLLRRQRDLHRRPHLPRLHRGRGQALRGLRLARSPRERRQRPRRPRGGHEDRRGRGGAPRLRRRQDHHRLRQPRQAGHGQGPRRASWEGRGRSLQEGPRLAPGAHLPRARRGRAPFEEAAQARPSDWKRNGTA